MDKDKAGRLTDEEAIELDRRLGNFYKVSCCGKEHKINHCFVARLFITVIFVAVTLHIIYLVRQDLK
jgi:hypothetical protein